jgi:hypothetical protein
MNNRSYLVGILVVVLLLLCGWWFWKSKRVPTVEAPVKTAPTSPANTVAPSGTAGQPGTPADKSAVAAQIAALEKDPKVMGIEKAEAAENAKSLDFYGEAVDQYGNPVAGVKVKAGVGLYLGIDQSGGTFYYTDTDAAGRFNFVGIHGAGMGPFILTKDGYKYDSNLPSGSRPKDYVPDPAHPVIFNMWKLKGAEPMVAYSISTAIPCDGTPTSYDLLTGKKVSSGGDFVITLTRNPVNIVRGQPFDWSVTLAIPSGGLTEVNDLYPNEAPADGYQPSITINMPSDMKNWDAALNHAFYFEIGSGQTYGRMTINIQADFQPPPTYFGAGVHLNPSPGDRNLEFDPTQAIKP